jgi:hypothetical protein
MMRSFSRRLAIVAGILLPIAETVRRWDQLGDLRIWPFWLDDWAIGGLLLYGAWRTRQDVAAGRPVLAAAWGFACGMGYASFFSQLAMIDRPDPSGASPVAVVAVKGVMLAVAIAALVATLAWRPAAGAGASARADTSSSSGGGADSSSAGGRPV